MSAHVMLYELRRMGWPALIGPPFALLAVVALALLATRIGPVSQVDTILSATLDVLPLVAGLAAASAVGGDAALELHASLPTGFRTTALRRLGLALIWSMLLAVTSTLALAVSGRLVWPISPAADQLIWLAPLLWLAGVGAALALGIRSAAAGSGLVGVLWVLERLFSDFFTGRSWLQDVWMFLRYTAVPPASWYWNRGCLIALAIVLFALAFWLLGRSERLLAGDS